LDSGVDLAGLQELIEAQRRHPELEFAMLADEGGRILAHTDTSRRGQFLLDLPQTCARRSSAKQRAWWTSLSRHCSTGGTSAGRASGSARRRRAKKLTEITLKGGLYALAAIVIGSVVAWLMGRRITRRLYAVQETIGKVGAGDRTARCAIAGADEAAAIAAVFNALLNTLDERSAALVRSETKSRILLRTISAGVIVHATDTRVLFSNPMAQELLGLSEEQLLGRSAIDPAWHFLREDGSIMLLRSTRSTGPSPSAGNSRTWSSVSIAPIGARQRGFWSTPSRYRTTRGNRRGHRDLRGYHPDQAAPGG